MFYKHNLHWTEHSKIKMRQYGLSKSKLIKLLYKPERKEEGIVLGSTALMQTNTLYSSRTANISFGTRRKIPGEIWLMYQDIKNERKIISAWRYPGVSKPGDSIPIPKDIYQELITNGK